VANDLRKFLGCLQSNRDGATAVEFALVSAPLIAVVLAMLQTSIIFFFDQALQSAAQTSARQLMTGAAQTAGMTQAQFKQLVCTNASTAFNCNNMLVDVQSASNFAAINTSPITVTYDAGGQVTNSWTYAPGNAGDIVIVRVMYDWPIFGQMLGLGLSNQPDGGHLLVATAVYKNEPYQ
jgi:Flp pilus assembly protein TadG